MLFIYWLEDDPQYSARIQAIHDKMQQRRDTLCASAFVLGEVLTGLYKRDAMNVISEVKEFFRPPRVELLAFGVEAAQRYAQIRAKHRVSPADSVHLATAAQAGVDLFLTNDKALAGLIIPGIQFIAGMDVNLF
jgi:uncharacterized protein